MSLNLESVSKHGKQNLSDAIQRLIDLDVDLFDINLAITSYPEEKCFKYLCYGGSIHYNHDYHCGHIAEYLNSLSENDVIKLKNSQKKNDKIF